MGMRRFVRLTNGFSKKPENHLHMPSLYFPHSKLVRMHKSLKMTPAMAAGAINTLHDMTRSLMRLHLRRNRADHARKKIIQTETLALPRPLAPAGILPDAAPDV